MPLLNGATMNKIEKKSDPSFPKVDNHAYLYSRWFAYPPSGRNGIIYETPCILDNFDEFFFNFHFELTQQNQHLVLREIFIQVRRTPKANISFFQTT